MTCAGQPFIEIALSLLTSSDIKAFDTPDYRMGTGVAGKTTCFDFICYRPEFVSCSVLTNEITLADFDAVMTQDCVGGRCVKEKLWQCVMQQVSLTFKCLAVRA
ncbi:MAG: hypothetical protein ACI8WM_000260 [Burkholderiaceae bacterium]|jgi:hypothetical protein